MKRIIEPFRLILRALNEQLDAAGDIPQRLVAISTLIPPIWWLFTQGTVPLILTGAVFFWWVFRIMWKNGNL